MVTGLAGFKEWFTGYEEQYAVIGGTACDLLLTVPILLLFELLFRTLYTVNRKR
jgi:hypothetical protein